MVGSVRLAMLAGVMALGSVGATLALAGVGVPLVAAAVVAALVAGLVQFAALRQPGAQPVVGLRPSDATLEAQLQAYRDHSAALRHDLRGVMSPALMMTDRLLNHPDPAIQRAGTAVVRSIERATALLAGSRGLMAADLDAPQDPPSP